MKKISLKRMSVLEALIVLVGYSCAITTDTCGCSGICRCFIMETKCVVDCSNKDIDAIPQNIPSNVNYLLLSHNHLRELPNRIFHNMSDLRILDLSFNDLEELPADLFEQNWTLKNLNFANNHLKELPPNLLKRNKLLLNLFLSNNKLESIPGQLFKNNINLGAIILSDNKLKAVATDLISQNRGLVTIVLKNNTLTSIPRAFFKNNPALKGVWLSNNQLKELPQDLFIMNRKLKTVTFAFNNLEDIPHDLFQHTPLLNKLDLAGNHLRSIPSQLFSSTSNLEYLFLCKNNLEELPENLFTSINNLIDMTLCKNKLTSINRTALNGSTTLQFLTLYGNKLTFLPRDLFSDVNLSGGLDLSDNNITEIPDGLFCSNKQGFHDLSWLLLRNNKLVYLQKNCFRGLQKLTHIFLNGNNIEKLAEDLFLGTAIQFIYIFSNNLTELSSKSFNNNFIQEIQIYNNKIKNITTDAFVARRNKLQIYLHCHDLNEIPFFNKTVAATCITDRFIPKIILPNKTTFGINLVEDGFNCSFGKMIPDCTPCPPGTYGDGANKCLPCPAGGFFQDDFSRLECKLCNKGTFVNSSGGDVSDDCGLCPEGTDLTRYAGYRACFCKMNYSRIDRFEGCSLCLEEGLNCSEDYKSLQPGYYWNWSFPGANVTEYSSFVFHLRNDSISFNKSSQRYRLHIPKVHECPLRYSCENKGSFTAGNITGNCKDGYRGWLCSKCQSSYYSILNICIPCPNRIWIILEIIAIFVLGVGLYVFIIWQNKRHKKYNTNERSLLDKISSQMKIALGFYQVVGELFESFHDITWVGPLKLLGELIAFLKVNVLRVIIRPHCYSEKLRLNTKVQFIISLSFPLGMCVSFVSFYYVWKIYLKYRFRNATVHVFEKLKNLKEKLSTYAVLLLFITYPPTCDVIFKLYPGACKTFYIYENDTSVNITLLRSDFDLNCKTLRIYQIFAYTATIVYVALFPCTLLVLLHKYHTKTGIIEFDDRNDNSTCYQPDSTVSERSHLINDKSERSDVPVWVNFLCENYKPRFWYWEIIELARKVTQTVLVTLLGFEDALTKLLTIGISVLFLTLHAKLSPMTSHFEQRLQMFSLIAIFINVLIASVPIPQNYQPPLSTILILMNMIIILVIAGEVALFIIRFIKRKIAREKNK